MSLKNDWNFTENKLPLWSKLEVLYHIVKAGSLVQAAKVLKTDQPTLSSKLATLEKKFGFKLINRSTPHKPLSLTRKGEEVFRVAEQTYMLMREMNTRLYDDNSLKGKVRLSTTHAIANYIAGPLLIEFAEEYPDINVEVLCNDVDIDIINNEVDLAIRPRIESDPTLVQEPLFTFQVGLYASQKYLDTFGEPKTAEDLDHHRLLTFARSADNPYSSVDWCLKLGRGNKKPREPFYTANSTSLLLRAAEAGLGITPFHSLMRIGKNPNLVPILKNVKSPLLDVYLICPKNLLETRRVSETKNFLIKNIQKLDKESLAIAPSSC